MEFLARIGANDADPILIHNTFEDIAYSTFVLSSTFDDTAGPVVFGRGPSIRLSLASMSAAHSAAPTVLVKLKTSPIRGTNVNNKVIIPNLSGSY